MTARIRSLGGWTFALAGSLLLNIALFALMPGLIQKVPDMRDDLDEFKQIQVIRMKRPETPPKKKKPEPPKKPKPVQQVNKAISQPKKPRPQKLKPRLDFKLNTKLPPAPMDLAVPEMASFSMDVPALKGSYLASELDAPLRTVKKMPPLYPVRAKRRRIEGYVTVEFNVTRNGYVENIRIIESEPKGIFDKSVLACVSKWQFKPGTVEGVPVETRAATTIRFKLEE